MNEIDRNKTKTIHGQHEHFAFGTQRNLYSTDSFLGFHVRVNADFRYGVGGITNANFSVFRYQHVGIPQAKLWR